MLLLATQVIFFCASFYLPPVSQKLTSSYISKLKFSETHARRTWRSPATARPRNRFQLGAAEQTDCGRSMDRQQPPAEIDPPLRDRNRSASRSHIFQTQGSSDLAAPHGHRL